MGKISLRHYNEEIDVLIDEGNYKTAIEYSKHILTIYPKHADTYRLLGKAFLESERFTDAIDIFQRLLSCIPNDYIAHIGMSVIREDEANLDAAIFHMERAYEVQPTNQTLLKELKRLYGLRDGVEPSKLRLTTGALAKMYAHGDLYSQAIAELLSALVEDEKRPDLMILLAEMYYKSNQIAETVEVCTSILENLPYCFVANDLLARIMIQDNRNTESLEYLNRLYEIDPYIKHSDFPNENPNDVLAEKVEIESYEFHFSDSEDNEEYQPVELHNTEELLLNDWQNSFAEQLNEQEIESQEHFDDNDMGEDLPDWLRSDDTFKTQLNPKDLDDVENNDKNFDLSETNNQTSTTFDLFSSLASSDNNEDTKNDIELDNWMNELKEPTSATNSDNISDGNSDWLKQLGAIGEYSEDENEADNDENDSDFNLDTFLNDVGGEEITPNKNAEMDEIKSVETPQDDGKDDSDWLNNIMDLSSEAQDNDIKSDDTDVSGLNEELKGIVDEGNEAEDWLNSMASLSDEQFNEEIEEPIDSAMFADKSPAPAKSANLDWLDEMKKEAIASSSQESSEDALNLLGDLGILDSLDIETESEMVEVSKISPEESTNFENETLSWLDDLKNKNEFNESFDDNSLEENIDDKAAVDKDTSAMLDGILNENSDDKEAVAEENNLSEGLAWLDSLATDGEIDDNALMLGDDEDNVAVDKDTSVILDENSDDKEAVAEENNLSEGLAWLDSLATDGEIDDNALMLGDDEDNVAVDKDTSVILDENSDDKEAVAEENKLSESLSWLDSLAEGGEINDDALMLDDDEDISELKVSSENNEKSVEESFVKEENVNNLEEGLSWLDELASGGDISDENLEPNLDIGNENYNSNNFNKEPIVKEEDDLSWLNELEQKSMSDEDNVEIKDFNFKKDDSLSPSTIIEEDEEQIYGNSNSKNSGLEEGLSWLDSLDSNDLSDDQLLSAKKDAEKIPATIIEENIDEEAEGNDDFSSNSDKEENLSWLENLEDQEDDSEPIASVIEDNTTEDTIIKDEDLEKLQDTASWKNSLTTDEEYSDDEMNEIDEDDEKYQAYIEESPDVEEIVKTPANSSWLEELEKQSALSTSLDESAEADTDWLYQLENEEAIDANDDQYSLQKSINEGINWVEDIDLENSQTDSNNLSEEIPEWLSALSVAEKNWDENSSEELSRLAENTSAAWAPEFGSKEDEEEDLEIDELLDEKATLNSIKAAINNKEFNNALEMIFNLIHKNESVEELVQIMEDMLLHEPMNIKLLQTMGDAELKCNRLDKAMEYYTKAEKLIR